MQLRLNPCPSAHRVNALTLSFCCRVKLLGHLYPMDPFHVCVIANKGNLQLKNISMINTCLNWHVYWQSVAAVTDYKLIKPWSVRSQCALWTNSQLTWTNDVTTLSQTIQYTPRGFPTFRKTPRKIFRTENLPVFSKSVFLGVFSIFPPRTFYRPSEVFLRGTQRKQNGGYRWFKY